MPTHIDALAMPDNLGWGVQLPKGELLPVITFRRQMAMRLAVWYSRPKPGVSYLAFRSIDSEEPLNTAERDSWRWLYRHGTRVVRVRLEVADA